MNKIIPSAYTGNSQIIISETFAILPKSGLRVSIPTSAGAEENTQVPADPIVLVFEFPEINEDLPQRFETRTSGREITIKIPNFVNILPMGLTKPLYFSVGKNNFSLIFFGQALVDQSDSKNKTLLFTLTVSERGPE